MKSIPLSPFDLQGSFSNIPYAFFYENTQSENDFMPFDLLKGSLWASLKQFPILTGRLRARSTGHIIVEVDADNPNQPDIRETLCDSVHWSQLKEASFAWDAWPAGVATVGPIATAAADGEIKLLNIHVMRLAQNSGVVLFINIPHYVVDGVGYFAFINHWAKTMRMQQDQQQQQQEEEEESKSELSFDRGIIQKHLPAERTPLDPLTESIYGQRNLLVDWLAWLSPTTLGGLLSKTAGMARGEAHLFRISRASLDQVHKAVQPYIPASTRLSDNDLLVAFISKTYIQSQPQPEPPTGFLSRLRPSQGQPETHCTVRVPSDVRRHLNVREIYTGNLLMGTMVRTPLAELARPTSSESLATAALNVRQSIERVQPGLVAAYHDLIRANPTSHLRPLAFTATRTTTSLVTTSQVRFPMYEADFGGGRPCFVCLTPVFAGSYTMAAILPTPEGREGGVYVLLTSNVEAMQGIKNNKYWNELVEMIW